MKFEPQLHKLPNGLTVILDPMDAATTKVLVAFDTGSRDESPNEYGITHFCEHMLCKGTSRFPSYNALDDYIGDNSGGWNASTSNTTLRLYGRICYENTDVLLDVFSDMLQNSLFDTNVIENERGIILDELRRSQDNQDAKFREFLNKSLLSGQWPEYRTLGTAENIKSFTRNQLQDWVATRMSAKNCVICVSGRIESPEKLLKKIRMKYAFMPTTDVTHDTTKFNYTPGAAHMDIPDRQNTSVTVLVPELWQFNKDNIYKRMCVAIFNAWLRRQLYDVLRQENGLVYGVRAFNYGPDELTLMGIQTTAVPSNLADVVATTARVVNKVYTENPVTDEFIKRYNSRCKLGDADFLESNEARADRLVRRYFDTGELYDFESTIKEAESISVGDIIKYTNGYFSKPVSIITSGAQHNIDLMKIWNENIGDLNKRNLINMVQDTKCR